MALRFRLIPRNEDFYTQFSALADQLRIGGDLLEQMLAQDPVVWEKVDEIKEVEHKCRRERTATLRTRPDQRQQRATLLTEDFAQIRTRAFQFSIG